MDLGVGVVSAVDSWKVAQRAEALGFSHVWFADTQMIAADVFLAMALAAEKTTRIRLGTGVLVPTNRIAPVAAAAVASLSKLAPGRIDVGVGTGYTARNTMGLPAMRIDEMQEYVRVLRGLLRSETVEWEAEGARHKIRFLSPDAGLIDLAPHVPIHVSAFGPRGRAVAASDGDGWMTFVGRAANGVRDAQTMAEACRAAGRKPDSLYKSAFTMGCVLAPGESADSPRARAQAGPFAMTFFHSLMDGSLKMRVPSALREAVEDYRRVYESYAPADARYLTLHRGHFMFVRPEEQRFLTADMLRDMTFTGTVEELRARIRMLRDAGYQQIAVFVAPGHEDAVDDWARVMEGV
jgi:alkanesulfonate monooxygenase SsuD/methylene tetrahydromethanopterin reductase-like flavin-dependent oxidoreductase (luciferase family)